MSEPPVAVVVCKEVDGETVMGGCATFDDIDEAVEGIKILFRFFAFDQEDSWVEVKRI